MIKKWLSWMVVFVGLFGVFFAGCRSKEAPGGKKVPRVTLVEIIPGQPGPGDVLTVRTNYRGAREDEDVSFEYKWYVNGKEFHRGAINRFSSEELKEGDEIYVEVRAHGEHGFGPWKNSKPVRVVVRETLVAKVRIEPARAYTNTALEAVVNYGRVDPDEVEIFYSWFVNGEEISGEDGEVLSPKYYRQGDEVHVLICTDGDFEGITVRTSDPVKILNRDPVVISGPHFEIEDTRVNFWIEADDPDGDTLNYSVLVGPAGTRINPETGDGYWTMKKELLGEVKLVIKIEDGHGGWVRREGVFALTYEEPSAE